MLQATDTGKLDRSYYHQTRRPLNNLVMLLPLLLAFHLGAMAYPADADRMLLAPQYILRILHYLGAPALLGIPAIAVIVILLVQHVVQREPWTVDAHAVVGMVGESVLWTVPLIALNFLTGRISAAQTMPGGTLNDIAQKALVAIGAGIYEEFIFRMLLITALLLILVDVVSLKKDAMTVIAVLASAVVFSLCHSTLLGGGEQFLWGNFIFRTIAGVLWGGLYLYRGIGIAVGSHIAWDLFVLLA